MPVTPSMDQKELIRSERRGEILYSDGYAAQSESEFGLDNDEVQGYMNLAQIFSFLRDEDENGSITSSSDNRSVSPAVEENTITIGNEFKNAPGNEYESQLQTGKRNEGCNNLGRGDCPQRPNVCGRKT